MLKVELHTHTADDPCDAIPHTAEALIARAAALGYDALAITLHDRRQPTGLLVERALARGIVLLPGLEKTLEGKHVLLINFPAAAERLTSFEALADLKAQCRGVVIAPHPFYPTPSSLGATLDRLVDVVDAVEVSALYTRWLDFNRRAIRWAHGHHKPLVGASDAHCLAQLGSTFTLVDAPPEVQAICAAIRAGRTRLVTRPLSPTRAARLFARMAWSGLAGRRRPSRPACRVTA